MIGVSYTNLPELTSPHIRPVNLSTDLSKLADLIEISFAKTMDSSGRAALHEMRYLSRMGPGVRLISHLNDLALGIGKGFVWEQDGELVGNVSIFRADWPSEFGPTSIIANVATHPAYQGRGIAQKLMLASLKDIHDRGGRRAILQVEIDNQVARHVYRMVGFIEERGWRLWQRGPYGRLITASLETDFYIRSRRKNEWRIEMALARAIRPQERGGLGWQRPLHPRYFHTPWWKTLLDWLNLRRSERLVVYDPSTDSLTASLWTEHQFGSRMQASLLNDPSGHPLAAEALIHNLCRRFPRSSIQIEHPVDDVQVDDILRRYDFSPTHTFMHMRWETS